MPYPSLSEISNFFNHLTVIIQRYFPLLENTREPVRMNNYLDHQLYPPSPILQTDTAKKSAIIIEKSQKKLQLNMENISEFFNNLLSLIRDKNKINSYEFNVFDYIIKPNIAENNTLKQQNERKLSRIIADLLKPDGDHGQHIIFLEAFIEAMMKLASNSLQKTLIKLQDAIHTDISTISVLTEEPTHDSRYMDIMVDLGGKKGIVIENKPWTNDQKEQLKDYAEDANERFSDAWVLIYLHGSGKAANEYTLPNKKELVSSGNYLDADYIYFLTSWLRICREDDRIKSKKMDFFVSDFISYIEQTFKNDFLSPGE